MEFLSGTTKKETISIKEVLEGDYVGKTVKLNGAVHTIREIGEVAFIVLRRLKVWCSACGRKEKRILTKKT